MTQYYISGMSCAACSAAVEKAISGVSGVKTCTVNLLLGIASVEGGTDKDIINAVEKAGYSAKVKNRADSNDRSIGFSAAGNTQKAGKMLVASLCLLAVLEYIALGITMFNLPAPGCLLKGILPTAMQIILTAAIMLINRRFFVSGFRGIINRVPNMDSLISLGSGISFIYSIATVAVNFSKGQYQINGLYFDSAAMILVLVSIGKFLEAKAKLKTTDALKELINLRPLNALIEKDGKEISIPVEEIKIGDTVIVKPGFEIPADGVIISGNTAVDTSALTGESLPVDKSEGDFVSAGYQNISGFIKCRATAVGESTMLSQIINTVTDALASKAPVAALADRIAGIFVPAVMAVSALTFIIWFFTGNGISIALKHAISVLVVSCPCSLGLATPVAITAASGKAAACGLLFKNAATIENTGKSEIIVIDKTGTITKGTPTVTDVIPFEGTTEKQLLTLAKSIEIKSSHPISKAITDYAHEMTTEETECFTLLPGAGISGKINGVSVLAGNRKLAESSAHFDEKSIMLSEKLSNEGKTPVFFVCNNSLLGIIAVSDVPREDSKKAISELEEMGLTAIMLTGDNQNTANCIADKVGISKSFASLRPTDKLHIVEELKKQRKVIMVGDGINDSPALAAADISMAPVSGTDLAVNCADIALMSSSLTDAVKAIKLSRQSMIIIKENLFWAFGYNIFGIPLAAGLFIPLFGISLNPMFSAAAMSVSSILVTLNALRINRFDFEKSQSKVIKKSIDYSIIEKYLKEVTTMTETLKISGMMCTHCSGRVKEGLEKLGGVISANVSHETGLAIVEHDNTVSTETLKETVTRLGYTVE